MSKRSEDRSKAIATAARWAQQNAVFLDTETSGTTAFSEVVDIAFVNMSGETVFESLVRPRRPIPVDAERIHHISNEMVSDAPTFVDILDPVLEICAGKLVIAYNMDFDRRLIEQSALAYGWKLSPDYDRFKCAMKLYSAFFGSWNDARGNYRWHRLGVAAEHCGIEISATLHRARADADLGRRILLHMAASAQ